MYRVRLWSVRHARGLNRVYRLLEDILAALRPLMRRIGDERLERPMAASTGMSCPMNGPKQLRNGPCGGVRANGNCEVLPDMKCVWVAAWEGSQRIPGGVASLQKVQFAVDRRLEGRSSWLRAVRQRLGEEKAP